MHLFVPCHIYWELYVFRSQSMCVLAHYLFFLSISLTYSPHLHIYRLSLSLSLSPLFGTHSLPYPSLSCSIQPPPPTIHRFETLARLRHSLSFASVSAKGEEEEEGVGTNGRADLARQVRLWEGGVKGVCRKSGEEERISQSARSEHKEKRRFTFNLFKWQNASHVFNLQFRNCQCEVFIIKV